MKLEGSLVAIVTPFRDGAVDRGKLADLVRWHIEKGTNGICPCGTTGEAATLTTPERADVIRTVVETAKGTIHVVAGTGTNDTRTTIELTRMAKELGADAALVVTPYYNKPPQEGLFRHYEAITAAVDIPLVPYNVPGRTCVNLEAETTARISKLRNVIAIKEAAGKLDQVKRIRELSSIAVLSGDDAMTLDILKLGGVGVISVAANLIPSEMAELCSVYRKGDVGRAEALHQKLLPLFGVLFVETNPIPVKAAMEMLGLCSSEVRLPLCAISDTARKTVVETLRILELA